MVGDSIGTSQWYDIDQQLVNEFGRITKDEQWIHMDEEAAARGPFGGTIAHGFLTLSLLPTLMSEAFQVNGAKMVVNYGLDRVRYPAPVLVGQRIRAQINVGDAQEIPNGVHVVFHVIVERDGEDRPGCVADSVARYLN
jgi:acyl dehydratase